MIELYHHGSSVCAAKVRLVLAEKGLAWKGHYVDILKGDQFSPDYIRLNPKAVVPTLVHDGDVILESTVICDPDKLQHARTIAEDRRRMGAWRFVAQLHGWQDDRDDEDFDDAA